MRESEERYKLLFTRSPDVVFVLKGDHFVDVNSAVELVLGYKPEEVIGRSPWFISPELQPDGRSSNEKAREHIAAALESGPQVFDWVHKAKDGSPRDCIVSLSAYDQRGEIYVQAIVRDITDRKRAERAVLDRQARLDSIFRAAPAGIGMVVNRILTDVNDRVCEMTGHSREELIGQSSRILYSTQEDYEEVGRIKYEQIANFGTGTVETKMGRKDGSVFDVLLSSTPLDPGDLSQGVTFTMLDITERKQAQVALERSEQKYKNLVETTDTGYLIIDADGRVFDANAEYVRLTGYGSLGDILGRNVKEWTAQYDLQRNQEDIRKCMEKGFVRDLEIDYVAPDGKITPVEINATVIDTPDGKRILTLCRDISERRLAEEKRCAYEKQSEEQKRRFYRETILSVTDGKLAVCDPPELRPYLATTQLRLNVTEPSEVSSSRRAVKQFCEDHGLTGERLETFMIGVGEAITNAIKHAAKGRVQAGIKDGSVWVGVADKGPGIASLILPRAMLLRGFSTKPSLGLGYSIILEVCDRVLLKTGAQGTTVVLVRGLAEPELARIPESLPDIWSSIPG